MKRQPIPQAEFGFTSETFNLGQQSTPVTATGPKIMAEMTDAEREQVRERSRRIETRHERICRERREHLLAEKQFGPIRGENETPEELAAREADALAKLAASNAEKIREQYKGWKIAEAETTTPGIAPGSYWTKQAMRKAIATGGGR